MKPFLLTTLTCLISLTAFTHDAPAQATPQYLDEAERELITELGVVYVDMPKEDLAKVGYTKYLQKDYRKKGNEEWITFSDWMTGESGDLITFYLVDGKPRVKSLKLNVSL